MWSLAVHYALRNIKRTSLRTFFTIFSIALVMMLYTIFSGIGKSFTHELTKLLKSKSIDIVIQSKFSATPISSVIGEPFIHKIEALPEVHKVEKAVIGIKKLEKETKVILIGITHFTPMVSQLGITLSEGRYFRDKKEAVIAKRAASAANLQIGDTVNLDERIGVEIVGLYETWLGFLNASMFVPFQTAQTSLHRKGSANMLFLTLKDPTLTRHVIETINRDFKNLHAIRSGDFTQSMGILKAMFYLLHIVSVMTLIIASAIVMNTFMMAISERKQEIGILMAIGWSGKMVITVLWVEAVLLAIWGGLTGFLMAYPTLLYLHSHYPYISIFLPSELSLTIPFEILLLSILTATLAVLLPGWSIIRTNISKALRNE